MIGCQLLSAGRAFNKSLPTHFGVTNFGSILTQNCISKFGIFWESFGKFLKKTRKLYFFVEQSKWLTAESLSAVLSAVYWESFPASGLNLVLTNHWPKFKILNRWLVDTELLKVKPPGFAENARVKKIKLIKF